MTIEETETEAVEGTGELSYSMSITVGRPGGNTDVTITPNHNFDEIAPRLAFKKSFKTLRCARVIKLLFYFQNN